MAQLPTPHPVNLDKLNDELRAAFPAWVTGTPPTRQALYSVSTLTVMFPDETPLASVQAVLNAHNAATPSPAQQATLDRVADWADLRDAAAQMVTRCTQIETQMNGSPTNAQVIAAVRDLAIGVRRLVKAVGYLAVREAGE